MKFKQEKFYSTILPSVSPHEIKYGDVLYMSNGKFFEIEDIDGFYVNESLSNTIDEEEIINTTSLENTKYTFYGADGRCIKEIPYDAEFSVFRSVEPIDLQFIDHERIRVYNQYMQNRINKEFDEKVNSKYNL